MERYSINTDDAGEFYITKNIDGMEYFEYDTEFIKKLREFDNIKSANFHFNKKTGYSSLSNKDIYIFINDFDSFCRLGYTRYMPKVFNKIGRKVNKIQNKKYKDIKTTIGFNKKTIATVGTIAMIAIVSTVHGIGKEYSQEKGDEIVTLTPEESTDNLEKTIDKIQEEIDSSINNEELVNVSTQSEQIETNDEKVIVDIGYVPTNEINRSKNYDYIYEKYEDIVEDKAEKWGISSDLVYSLMSLESAGKDANICQINFNVWKDKVITCYNFRDGKYESIVLTNNPDKYIGKDLQTINEEELLNPKTNISVACIMLRYSYDMMDKHIIASLQCYNYGTGAMNEILEDTALEYGTTKEEILSDQNNTTFLKNRFKDNLRNGKPYGDNQYVEDVFQYLNEKEPTITFKDLDDYNNIVDNTIYINNTYLNNEIDENNMAMLKQ